MVSISLDLARMGSGMHKMGGKWDGICCTLLLFRFVFSTWRLHDRLGEIIIALALAGSPSLWIFVVPEDELHGAVAGMKDLGGTTYYAGRENSTFGLHGGGFLLHEGLQRGHGMAWLYLLGLATG